MQRAFPGLFRWKAFFLIFTAAAGLVLLASCTEYERNGINSRPFNEPRSWEINPYGDDAFRN